MSRKENTRAKDETLDFFELMTTRLEGVSNNAAFTQLQYIRPHQMNAWLFTWEGTSGPALRPDTKIVAVVSSRRKTSAIEAMVDLLYCRAVDTAYDMSRLANKRRERENQYRHSYSQWNRFFYGRNLCIYARIVFNLKIQRDEAAGVEIVRWTDPPYLQVQEPGGMPVEVEPAINRELVRALKPLSLDISRQ